MEVFGECFATSMFGRILLMRCLDRLGFRSPCQRLQPDLVTFHGSRAISSRLLQVLISTSLGFTSDIRVPEIHTGLLA